MSDFKLVSVLNPSNVQIGVLALSAGTTQVTNNTVVFSNSNGVTFGLNDHTITASVAAGGGGSISAGTTRLTLGEAVFSNSNGLSFGVNGQTVTGSYTVPSTAGLLSNINVSAGTTSNLLSALTFSNANGVSFGLDASTITASHNGLTSQSNQQVTAANGGFAFQTLSFSNVNGFSFGTSAGSAITGSYTVPTVPAQFSGGVSTGGNTLGDTGVVTGRLVLAGGNNITLSGSTNGGSQTITISGPTTAAQSNQSLGFYAVGNTTGQSSSSTFDARTVSFVGQGIASVGFSNGSVNISVPSGGGGLTNIRVSAGTTSNLLSDITFANSNGVTFGLNASTITASVNAGGGITYSGYLPEIYGKEFVAGQQGQGTFFVQPMWNVPAFQFDNLMLPVNFTNSSNSSGSATISFWVGIYTKNVSTLSLLMSTSHTTALTMSGTAGSYSWYAGPRNYPIPWTSTISASDYWIGIGSRTTTGGTNMSISQFLASQPNSVYSGVFGTASNATAGGAFGQGFYSATTSAVPGSIVFTQIQASGSLNRRPPIYYFQSGTFSS
jgi:hypothetical protein